MCDRDLRVEDDDVFDYTHEEYGVCPACAGFAYLMGELGSTAIYRCRNCGMDHYQTMETNDD